MFRRLRIAALPFLAVALTGCATMVVSSHFQRDLDFTQYRTYDWGPPDALPSGDPRLDDNPFFNDYMHGAVEKQLAVKGLELSSGHRPDLLIHYHASVNRRIDVDRVDQHYGYHYGEGRAGGVTAYEAGTLILDVVDTRTNRVVWRGWAQDSFEGVIDNRDRLERVINRAIGQMLARFPPPL